jgi:hypothetical protein
LKATDLKIDKNEILSIEYIKAPPSKMDLRLDTLKLYEIFRICWGCSEEAMVKFSALYHVV